MIAKRRKLSEPKRTSFCISAKRRAEREASILRTQIANLLIEERVERARDLKVALHAKENEILQMIMNIGGAKKVRFAVDVIRTPRENIRKSRSKKKQKKKKKKNKKKQKKTRSKGEKHRSKKRGLSRKEQRALVQRIHSEHYELPSLSTIQSNVKKAKRREKVYKERSTRVRAGVMERYIRYQGIPLAFVGTKYTSLKEQQKRNDYLVSQQEKYSAAVDGGDRKANVPCTLQLCTKYLAAGQTCAVCGVVHEASVRGAKSHKPAKRSPHEARRVRIHSDPRYSFMQKATEKLRLRRRRREIKLNFDDGELLLDYTLQGEDLRDPDLRESIDEAFKLQNLKKEDYSGRLD
eukprot:g3323.t1